MFVDILKNRKPRFAFFAIALSSAQFFDASMVEGGDERYEPNWSSLSRHNDEPEWLSDAKLGIYFHWGVYTVPAYGSEWYPFHMYRPGTNDVKEYHRTNYGDPSEFNYHDFVPMFTGEHFDADEWAQLFKESGARFAGPCAQHHDGFAMWKSSVNPWNSFDKGPKKDITGELGTALRKRGMKLITTFHHARNRQRHDGNEELWHNFGSHYTYHPDYATSSEDPELAKLYGNLGEDEFNEYWHEQLVEVIDQYSPDIMWFDSWLNYIPESKRQEFVAYYLNEAKKKGQDVVLAYKHNDLPDELGVLDIEQGGKKDLSESVWMTDVTLSLKSWSYIEGQKYKTADMVVRNMIDVWSKNGIVLLNISPTARGEINAEQRDVLREIGAWMKKHAEAVYETRPFEFMGFGDAVAGEGKYGGQTATVRYSASDGRLLQSKDGKTLYLFLLGKPEVGRQYALKKLGRHSFYPKEGVKRVTILGSEVEVPWKLGFRDFEFTIPDAELDEIATVLKLELN
ncbi:alpha-L-fucosidase [Pelagicoccus sp. SDUM812005]|uniref:alpha-L-fucosidase n=1 Tax=Pelagicoccus sp. SDUM812005 TaxID=3041257 RepID=UPI00280FBCD7|nr:alpha-L-fucosidase [Pelagicoccus sp. SDUM812005]MDQ8180332.1 alpha-L-fucosidase [Pelagicoccus sp. SDUM812005]